MYLYVLIISACLNDKTNKDVLVILTDLCRSDQTNDVTKKKLEISRSNNLTQILCEKIDDVGNKRLVFLIWGL